MDIVNLNGPKEYIFDTASNEAMGRLSGFSSMLDSILWEIAAKYAELHKSDDGKIHIDHNDAWDAGKAAVEYLKVLRDR